MSTVDTAHGLGGKVEELERELTEAREQQAATARILRAISNSPFDLHGIFQEIAITAARLCDAYDAGVLQCAGDHLRLVAHRGQIPVTGPIGEGTLPLRRGVLIGRAVIDRTILQVADLQAEAEEYPEGSEIARRLGHRTILAVPLIRGREAIGAIFVRRTEVRPFTDRQIELLKTFADQAVIAIENTRLFEAEQTSKSELQQSLKYQTAISEVLNVISRSQTQIRPVFDAILESAVRLCDADQGGTGKVENGTLVAINWYPDTPEISAVFRDNFPRPVDKTSLVGRAVIEGRVLHVPDLGSPDAPKLSTTVSSALGYRSQLTVPLVRNGQPVGVLALVRKAPEPFTPAQIALATTFADQAVIAIENTKLFDEVQARTRELQESLQYQTSISDVLNVISRSTTNAQPVFDAIVKSVAQLFDRSTATITRLEGGQLHYTASASGRQSELEIARVRAVYPLPFEPERSPSSRAILEQRIIEILDAAAPDTPEFTRQAQQALGFRAATFVPLIREGRGIGAIALAHPEPGFKLTDTQRSLVQTFADQAVIAIENARLFEEVQARTRELAKTVEDLEIASQHKSQFVANMSHELRTPLAAILGYTELIQEGFYEPQGPKSLDALTRIRSNGKHLLGLINTVLDIAKIESGQFNLNLGEYALENVVETVHAATEALAENKKLRLTTEVAERLPIGVGDEQRLTQVLLNLVGNAIKFTDAGEIRITAAASNGHFALSVTDTGPGIPQEHQARIFEQFHQVDSSNTKAKGGTGLGLAIAKQIVEMHGGRIWVESIPGEGATFQMELPILAKNRKPTT